MATENYYEGIGHIVQIDTDKSTRCEHCAFEIGGDNFVPSVNHYIEKHGYKLLHVGQRAYEDEGMPVSHTVAILGK